MHPCKGLPYVLLRLEALHQLDNLQIRDIDIGMFREIVVLFRIANSLLKEILGDLPAVLLRNNHGGDEKAATALEGG